MMQRNIRELIGLPTKHMCECQALLKKYCALGDAGRIREVCKAIAETSGSAGPH